MTVDVYGRPDSLEEAFDLLQGEGNVAVIGGGAYLRLPQRHFDVLVDLSRLELDYIRETPETVEIGAYTTLRSLETSELLTREFDGLLPKSVSHVVGVQMRNIVTVGGTVGGRYGFSDLLTALVALGGMVHLYRRGEVPIDVYLEEPKGEKDIVEKIVLPKRPLQGSFGHVRLSEKDFAILNVAVVRDENGCRIAVGSRPAPAKLAREAMETLKGQPLTVELAEQAGRTAAGELRFGGNLSGSSAYRQALCKTLVRRGLMEVNQ